MLWCIRRGARQQHCCCASQLLQTLLLPKVKHHTECRKSRLRAMLQVLVPAMLFGISIGVVLCPMSPEWLQTLLLSVLLVAVSQKVFGQGVRKWREEQAARECVVLSRTAVPEAVFPASIVWFLGLPYERTGFWARKLLDKITMCAIPVMSAGRCTTARRHWSR